VEAKLEVPRDLEAARSLMAPLARLSRHSLTVWHPFNGHGRKHPLFGCWWPEVVEILRFQAFVLHCANDTPEFPCKRFWIIDAETRT